MLTPREILEEIERLPPFQQKDVLKHYVDLDVDWKMKLSSATAREGNAVYLFFAFEGYTAFATCTVSLLEYPELRVIKAGEKFSIRGKIELVDPPYFRLKNVKLESVKNTDEVVKQEGKFLSANQSGGVTAHSVFLNRHHVNFPNIATIIACVIALLLYIGIGPFNINGILQSLKAKNSTINQNKSITLLYLFEHDFNTLLQSEDEITYEFKDRPKLSIKYEIHFDFVSQNKFISFYIPPVPYTFQVCADLVDDYKAIFQKD